jgi:hypothetical protein
MQMRLLFGAAALLVVALGATAKADDTYACTVLLCPAPAIGVGFRAASDR